MSRPDMGADTRCSKGWRTPYNFWIRFLTPKNYRHIKIIFLDNFVFKDLLRGCFGFFKSINPRLVTANLTNVTNRQTDRPRYAGLKTQKCKVCIHWHHTRRNGWIEDTHVSSEKRKFYFFIEPSSTKKMFFPMFSLTLSLPCAPVISGGGNK